MTEKAAFLQDSLQGGEQLFFPAAVPIETEPVIMPNKEFRMAELQDQLKDARETFFLNPEIYNGLELPEYMLRTADFTLREDWAEGRTQSVHQVFFGELRLVVDKGDMYEEELAVTMPVAMKPYHSAARLGVHEYAAYNHINSAAFIPTLDTVGFWVDSNGRIFMMTNFEPDVRSLDNVNWHDTNLTGTGDRFSIIDALQRSAFILGKLHGHGYTHGDGQIKNMAIGRKGVKLVDPEQMRKYGNVQGGIYETDSLAGGIRKDLDDLVSSVINLGFLATRDRVKSAAIVKHALLEPHASMIHHPSNPYRSHELDQAVGFINRDILKKI